MMMPLEPFMYRKVVVLSEDTSIKDAAKAMRDNDIGSVVVIDSQRRVSGIVTDRDICCRFASESTDFSRPISEIMSSDLVTADETMSLSEIVRLMTSSGVRRIPILQGQSNGNKPRKCIGIITVDDLIAARKGDASLLSQIIRRQVPARRASDLQFERSKGFSVRSDAHKQQTLERFYRHMSHAASLDENLTPQVAQFLLGAIVMRITYSAKEHFLAQLPRKLANVLMRLPPGPDRNITVESMMTELHARFKFSEDQSYWVLTHFFQGLEQWLGVGQIKHLKAQLPEPIRDLFKGLPLEQDRRVGNSKSKSA